MIGLIGINHKQASVDERAAFALSPAEASMLIEDWQACGLLQGAVVLSTCNRVEIYYEAESGCQAATEARLVRSLLSNLEVSPRLGSKMTLLRDEEAVRHLFRLASGLESMVVGETQILGQLKDAYRMASSYGLCNGVLSRLFHRAFEVAKRIRTSFLVSGSPLSAGSVAVDKLLREAPEVWHEPILIVGAGMMAEKTFERLHELGASQIGVYNRTRERAQRFAEHHPSAHVYCEGELRSAIERAHAIFVATSAPSPIILPDMLVQRVAMCYIFDLAVPRNVAESVASLPYVQLYSIDQLSQMGLQLDTLQLEEIEAILDQHIELFVRWREGAQMREAIGTIQRAADSLLERELSKLPSTLSPQERALIEQYDEHLRTTFTTALASSLREISHEGKRRRYIEAICALFDNIISKEQA